MSSEEEIYRSSSEELRQTMENQREAYERINQLAVDLAKIDLLTVSAVLAGVSVSAISLSLPLVAGVLTFVYALWCCTRIYQPRSFPRGLSADAVTEIDELARNGRSAEEHYRQLMFSYGEAISHVSDGYSSVKTQFRHALWASIASIILFALVAIRELLSSYPLSLDAVLVSTVSVVVLWARGKYREDE